MAAQLRPCACFLVVTWVWCEFAAPTKADIDSRKIFLFAAHGGRFAAASVDRISVWGGCVKPIAFIQAEIDREPLFAVYKYLALTKTDGKRAKLACGGAESMRP